MHDRSVDAQKRVPCIARILDFAIIVVGARAIAIAIVVLHRRL
jgi:hypothetical protein